MVPYVYEIVGNSKQLYRFLLVFFIDHDVKNAKGKLFRPDKLKIGNVTACSEDDNFLAPFNFVVLGPSNNYTFFRK